MTFHPRLGYPLIVVWAAVAAACAGFVLPWASVDASRGRLTKQLGGMVPGSTLQELTQGLSKRVGKVVVTIRNGAETITGELPDLSKLPSQVRGYEIPRVANRQDVVMALALTELLTGERELGMKAYVVYLVPGLAALCALFVTVFSRRRPVCAVVGVLGLAVGGIGVWKLATAKTDLLLAAIAIGPGLWLSCAAYLVLGLAALSLAFRRDGTV